MERQPTVLLTGVHSGVNPSPGLGTARSLRAAWPGSYLVGVDYSVHASGLAHDVFDEVVVLPSWRNVDETEAALSLVKLVENFEGSLISGLDLEAELLSSQNCGRILVPPRTTLEMVGKSRLHEVARLLDVMTPETRDAASLGSAIEFCQRHGWRVWVKGHRYEAIAVSDPNQLEMTLRMIAATWGQDPLLQAHIHGHEESLAFCALAGELLMACKMRKLATTGEGKTWSGQISPLDPSERDALSLFVRVTNWTGGGEMEYVRESTSGQRYLIDLNPRFPAWIHGATISGFNLPAALISAATAMSPEVSGLHSTRVFTRVVLELPSVFATHNDGAETPALYPLSMTKGHPSGMPALSHRLSRGTDRKRQRQNVSQRVISELTEITKDCSQFDLATPLRLFLAKELQRNISSIAAVTEELSKVSGIPVIPAYSLKTNPSPDVVSAIHASGLSIETISMGEFNCALDAGFAPTKIILNGPAKWHPELALPTTDIGPVFCDSYADLRRTLAMTDQGVIRPQTLGIRVRPPGISSRFGIPLHDRNNFINTARLLSDATISQDFGIHIHVAPSAVGVDRWVDSCIAAIKMATSLSACTGLDIRTIDFGGGWPSGSIATDAASSLGTVLTVALESMPQLRRAYIEPGKALTQSAHVLISRVLEIRDGNDSGDAAILDCSVADLPDFTQVGRQLLWHDGQSGTWSAWSDGTDEVYGRICMENDILRRQVALPTGISPGDLVAILNAGAYEMSMRYDFAG